MPTKDEAPPSDATPSKEKEPEPATPTDEEPTETSPQEGETSGKTKPEGAGKETSGKKSKGCSKDEILAVLAHELGHWKLSHNLKNLTVGEVSTYGC